MRVSIVDHFSVSTILFGSTVEIGDVRYLNTSSTVLALQQKSELFIDEKRPGIRLPPPAPICRKELNEPYTLNLQPCIHVGCISVLAFSVSGVGLIGSAQQATGYSTIKHIRKLAGR
ncbi:spore germination protein GerPE [Bacillus xiapuensis]|uniref:spore germination protein GerPE n=1 Tax=Bacillus xiapuensis TaxID=2014075 RepID=UPI000C23F442|nr:spore germination protein GerPE [Bacillus xiapuensis]